MKPLVTIFGNQVRYFRKMKGLSQEQLASIANLHRTYIGAIERGERNASLKNVEKIATSLEVPVAALLVESDET